MSIYARKNVWWIDVTAPSGKRIRRSTGTTNKKDAQKYHDKLKFELWNIDKMGDKPDRLFDEALVLYLKTGLNQKDFETKQRHARYFRQLFQGRAISSLTNDELQSAIPTHNSSGKALSPSTQNRYRSSLKRILSLAYQSEWIDKVPYIPRRKEPKIRVRWITKEQAVNIINALNLDWMKNVCSFALLTGARMSEIFSLTWDKIDWVRSIAIVTMDNAKSGKARSLPLNSQAIELLRSLENKQTKFIFTRDTGKRVYDIDRRDLRQALKQVNVENFNFHDFRHTWASWHVQAGTPLFTLKEMGGWETLEMVKKYAHLNVNHILDYANHVTFMTQNQS